jgi:hypothetical protein
MSKSFEGLKLLLQFSRLPPRYRNMQLRQMVHEIRDVHCRQSRGLAQEAG